MHKMKALFSDPFIRSSLLFSIVNLLSAGVAYVIIVFVSRRGDELFNNWNALNGVLTIFLTFTAGFSLYYAKTLSRIAKDHPEHTASYLRGSEKYLHNLALRFGWIILLVLLGLAAALKFLTWPQAIIIGVNIYLELWSILYRMYFLGRLEYNKAMILTLVAAVARFVCIITFLSLSFGIDSLVIGSLLGSGLSILIGKLYTTNIDEVPTTQPEFTIPLDFLNSLKASGALIAASVLLQIGQVATQGLITTNDSVILGTVAILNTFTSILFYGASAFLSLFVVNATRSESRTIYHKTLGVVTAVTLLGIGAISIIWHPALTLLKKDAYQGLLPQFLLFSVFMIFYNLFFVSIQYLISQYKYRTILIIGGLVLLTSTILVANAVLKFTHDNYILYYSLIQIVMTAIIFGYAFLAINKDSSTN